MREIEFTFGWKVREDGSIWTRWTNRGDGRKKEFWLLSDEWERVQESGGHRYPRVNVDGQLRYVHHVVLEAFVGLCPDSMVACHENDDPDDNRLSNLRWDTHSNNVIEAFRNGKQTLRGEQSGTALLTNEDASDIRQLFKDGYTTQELADTYCVTFNTVKRVLQNITYRCPVRSIVYDDVNLLWQDTLRELIDIGKKQGSRDGDVCGEIIGYAATLDAAEQKTLVSSKSRALSRSYAAAEILWYASGVDDIACVRHYAPSYSRFADDKGVAYGAYGPRMMNQLPAVIQCLKNAPLSRQAVLAIWEPRDLIVASIENTVSDVPCSLSWQFLLRDGALHMVATMRSNDAWLGLPYDVMAFTAFQRVVASELNAHVGMYHHRVGSMHLYSRHETKAVEATKEAFWRRRSPAHGWDSFESLDGLILAASLEKSLREHGTFDSMKMTSMGDMSRDLFISCARKLRPELFGNSDVISPRFHE